MKIGYTEDLVCLRFNGKDLMAEYISDLEVKYTPKLMLYIIKMHNQSHLYSICKSVHTQCVLYKL